MDVSWFSRPSTQARRQQTRCLRRACFLVRSLPSSLCPRIGKRAERALLRVSFMRALILSMRVPPSWHQHLPKAPSPRTITFRIRFQHMNLGRRNIHFVTLTFQKTWLPGWFSHMIPVLFQENMQLPGYLESSCISKNVLVLCLPQGVHEESKKVIQALFQPQKSETRKQL